MEVPLPWERLLWSGRSVWPPGARYALTDFRLVRVNGRRFSEIAVHDIRDVRCERSWIDRLFGTSTLPIAPNPHHPPTFELRHIPHGPQLAATLVPILDGRPLQRERKKGPLGNAVSER